MTGESLNILQDQLEKLKQLFPETFTEGKIDWEKLQATLGKENIEFHNERYVLNWAGKADAFKVLQIPSTGTLQPVHEESINFNTTENVFIEGENLEVLKILQKAYYRKAKCIIIDPPYNTGNDSFIYPDRFKESKEDYQKRIGDKDEEGYLMKEGLFRKNSKDSGHFHSNWLSMMYPRLFLAKNLLRDDGVIFVHIDDNEVHNLRLIMNEIFGEENFIEQIVWKSKFGAGAKPKAFITVHEYILCYSKNFSFLSNLSIPLSDKARLMYNKKDEKFEKRGYYGTWPLDTTSMDDRPNLRFPILWEGKQIWPKKQWLWSKQRVEEALKNNELVIRENDGKFSVRYKKYEKDAVGEVKKSTPLSLIDNIFTQDGTKELTELDMNAIFGFPKPSKLLKELLKIKTNENNNEKEIILDFFAGSGTTAQAVLEQNKQDGSNRKFLLVQLPELTNKETESYKTGYKNIADIGKDRIRKVIEKIEKEKAEKPDLFGKKKQDLGFKVFKLSPSNFKIWRGNEITEENLEQQLDAFIDPVKEGSEKENMLFELMLKAGYLLTDKVETKELFFSVNDGELIIALEEMNQTVIEKIISLKPKKVITLDKLFTGNDQLKTNVVLQMKDAEIDFKTI